MDTIEDNDDNANTRMFVHVNAKESVHKGINVPEKSNRKVAQK